MCRLSRDLWRLGCGLTRGGLSVVCLGLGLLVLAAGLLPLSYPTLPSPYESPEETKWETYLAPGAAEPTFRFQVMHWHMGFKYSACFGYLYVTRSEVRYVVETPEQDRSHAFTLPRESASAGLWYFADMPTGALELKFPKGREYHFWHIPPNLVGKLPAKTIKGMRKQDVLPWGPLVLAITRFDEMVQKLGPQATGAPTHEQQPAPRGAAGGEKPLQVGTSEGPKLRVMDPTVPDPSMPVEVTAGALSLRGVALDPNGVAAVMVNGREAEMRSAGDIKGVMFLARDITLREGLNRVTIEATNVAGAKAQLVVFFWCQGEGVRVRGKAFNKLQVLELLTGGVASARIATLVKERGIDFEAEEDYVEALRAAGAKEELIQTLKSTKPQKP